MFFLFTSYSLLTGIKFLLFDFLCFTILFYFLADYFGRWNDDDKIPVIHYKLFLFNDDDKNISHTYISNYSLRIDDRPQLRSGPVVRYLHHHLRLSSSFSLSFPFAAFDRNEPLQWANKGKWRHFFGDVIIGIMTSSDLYRKGYRNGCNSPDCLTVAILLISILRIPC